MRILMVHGRSQGGKDPARLRESWIESLRRGFAREKLPWPEDASFDFPYYGDALDRFAAGARAMTAGDATEMATAEAVGFDAFLREALSEIGTGAGIGETEIRGAEIEGGEIEGADIEARSESDVARRTGPQNWWWVRALARAIDARLTPMADFTIEAFLRDVYLYLRDRRTAAAIDGLVDDVVDAGPLDVPMLVIGHSLGSVVAYNFLRRRGTQLKLAGFVTVGSPLGLRAIADRLGTPENPVGHDGWFNAYDPRDIVALNPLDDAHFPVDPDIANHGGVDNGTANRHGIVGYLDDPAVARRVAIAIGRARAG